MHTRCSSAVVILLCFHELRPILGLRVAHSNTTAQDETPLATKLACFFKNAVDLKRISLVTDGQESLFDSMRPHGPLHARLGGTCAVVSSSGALQGHKYGSRIDAADTVMRFNNAPIEGFEDIVGHKDDIRFVNMHFARHVMHGKDQYGWPQSRTPLHKGTTYIYGLPTNPHFDLWRDMAHDHPDVSIYRSNQSVVREVAERLHKAFHQDWFHKHITGTPGLPTTGAVGMLVALSFCREVQAFAMASSRSASGKDFPYHYYEDQGFAGTNIVHESFVAEKELWRLMSTNANEIDETDIAVIPGFSTVHCKNSESLDKPIRRSEPVSNSFRY